MSDITALRDYLMPGGLRVYFTILELNGEGFFDISPRWLSRYLSQRNEIAPSTGERVMLGYESCLTHIAELVNIGAVVFDDQGLTAQTQFQLQGVSDDDIDARLEIKRAQKLSVANSITPSAGN